MVNSEVINFGSNNGNQDDYAIRNHLTDNPQMSLELLRPFIQKKESLVKNLLNQLLISRFGKAKIYNETERASLWDDLEPAMQAHYRTSTELGKVNILLVKAKEQLTELKSIEAAVERAGRDQAKKKG
ncbi:MAG: hypothetical protein Q9227_005527 [Pyrenula ochraceoflavens]